MGITRDTREKCWYTERVLYSYRLRNVSSYRRCTHVYVYALCSSSYVLILSFRVYFSYDILLQFSTVRDHLARRIHRLYRLQYYVSTKIVYEWRETPCARDMLRFHMCVDSRTNPRWISSLQGSKTSVPRIKSKKIREGWVGHGGGRKERREGRRW